MAQSNYSAGAVVWCGLLVAYLVCIFAKIYMGLLFFGIPLAMLTVFLTIRGVLRWTGRQLRGGT